MELPDITLGAFRDELSKIAGAARTGSMPVSVENAVKGLGRLTKMRKLGAAVPPTPGKFGYKSLGGALATGAALGAFGLHKGKKVVEDYQTGRAVRQAQGPGGM